MLSLLQPISFDRLLQAFTELKPPFQIRGLSDIIRGATRSRALDHRWIHHSTDYDHGHVLQRFRLL